MFSEECKKIDMVKVSWRGCQVGPWNSKEVKYRQPTAHRVYTKHSPIQGYSYLLATTTEK